MASRNGTSVFDLISDAKNRTVTSINGDGAPGVGIPADYARTHDITPGDNVVIRKQDGDEPILELHFNPNRSVEDSDEC